MNGYNIRIKQTDIYPIKYLDGNILLKGIINLMLSSGIYF